MASTRLRQTFRYPTDDSEDEVEQGMDEQDQADLITRLQTHDTRSTTLYTNLLLILPLSPIILYIPQLFSASTFTQSLAAITSLLASAYALYFLRLPPTTSSSNLETNVRRTAKGRGKAPVPRSYAFPPSSSTSGITYTEDPLPYLSDKTSDLVRKYLIPVNGAICIFLMLHELWQGREWQQGMMIGGGYVPGFILSVILWARRELRVLDLGELERLRYRTKAT
ncbi:hypothetical protein CC78DRAFT_614881 [Lojkania enalia]|uniref:Uncharacterized protein n=1 Tax=Lojkania enalia TaxID=147567 RepID=A0A9P4KDQ1_9PLEO|nr:hypothetical protein CC78DRAFT_614881 [Didymosphaeria enalia]